MLKNDRIKHDYTNEVELKSLSIREKNKYDNVGTEANNATINDLIKEYIITRDAAVKNAIIELSKQTKIDKESHEKFGEIVLLMIKKILTKPNYSGYSWSDEFYSNACYRVFKYIHNFDCDKKSDRTGQNVSAFSYISQIIIMSIIEVINKNNKNQREAENFAELNDAEIGIYSSTKYESKYVEHIPEAREFIIDYNIDDLYNEILKISNENEGDLKIYYPKNYCISFDEYAQIENILKQKRNISIIKLKL